MGIISLLKILKEGGSFLKDYVSQRYIPNAMRKTRTDEGFEFLDEGDILMTQALRGTTKELNDLAEKKIAQGQKIIDDLQNADPKITSIGNPNATRQQFEKIESELRDIERITAQLKQAASVAETSQEGKMIMQRAYQMEKVGSLIKGAMISLAGGGAGLYLGARGEDANPDFYKPETDPFRKQPLDSADEAVDNMMEKNFGEKTANVLMDFLSPIPRYVNKDNGRK